MERLSKEGKGGIRKLQAEAKKRLGGLSESSLAELDTRTATQGNEFRRLEAASESGLEERRHEAEMQRMRAEHGTAFAISDAIGGATHHIGGREIIEAGQRATHGSSLWSWLGLGSQSGEAMALKALSSIDQRVAPRLNASANGPKE